GQAVAFCHQASSSQSMECSDPAPPIDASKNLAVAINGVWEMQHTDSVVREHGNICPTLLGRMGTGGNNVPLVGIRRLTPLECERLQGFPDNWTDCLADSGRYRCLGNAVAVPVVRWIGQRIVENIKGDQL
ncbi:hypothetical protein LCGC14_3156820, partial [marine sediment metagenome]